MHNNHARMNIVPVLSEIFSRSDDEENDEELIDFIYMNENNNQRRRKKARVENFIESVVYRYNNEEFR